MISELDEAMRNLIDRDATPITFDEIERPQVRLRGRSSHPLMALACATVVVFVALGAVALRGGDSTEAPSRVASTPPSSTTDSGDASLVFTLPSESMSPTLRAGDRYTVDIHAYSRRDPVRGDVVALPVPRTSGITDRKSPLVKRIVGLPGETSEGRDGLIYIDGTTLEESSYLPSGSRSTTFGPVSIPAREYFVLGDNRLYSQDSTHFGPVAGSEFLGLITKVP